MKKKDRLLGAFREINERCKNDEEMIHREMDDLLLGYVDDKRITDEFRKHTKWRA